MANVKIFAHKCIIANKSPYFFQYFKDNKVNSQDEKLVVDFGGQV